MDFLTLLLKRGFEKIKTQPYTDGNFHIFGVNFVIVKLSTNQSELGPLKLDGAKLVKDHHTTREHI